MQEIAKKRGRPRKYGSKEEKARQDVIARRARRRLQLTATRRDVPFQVYVAHEAQAMVPSLTNQVQNSSPSSLAVPEDAPPWASRRAPSPRNSLPNDWGENDSTSDDDHMQSAEHAQFSVEGIALLHQRPRHTEELCSMTQQSNNIRSSWPQEPARASAAPSCEIAQVDDDIPSTDETVLAPTKPSHAAVDPAPNEDDGGSLVPGYLDEPVRSNTEICIAEDVHIMSERDSNRGQTDENLHGREGGDETANSDTEFQSEPIFEAESDSESDISDARSRLDIEDGPIDTTESSHALAREFLEKTWGRACDCDEENPIRTDGHPVFGLEQMAEYWQTLGVPDAIGPSPLPSGSIADANAHLDWLSILSGGNGRPNLDIERSQNSIPSIQRTWDVDSILCYASCLSINRGLYISYHPPVSRNIRGNVHIFHQKKALHRIPHLRLGSGRQSPQLGVYVFFPDISHVHRTTTYLTRNERQLWIDRLLLPAIRRLCPPDVIQHHPRSFDDVESKAHSRRRETCSGLVQNNMDMHHYLPQEYLEPIWRDMAQKTQHPDLIQFRGMFIVLSAKNIKLEAKSSTFHGCRSRMATHLRQVLDWSKADLSRTWIDVGVEDTAASGSHTFLLKSQCLDAWIESMKYSSSHPLIASEIFNWNLTGQVGSARVETARSHPLRRGGIAYAQRYNVNKDLFATASKRDHGLFGEPHLEGITCPPSLLDAWIVASRQNQSAGTATSTRSAPQLKRLRKAFEAMKSRIRHALDSSVQTSFGVREEYRISWDLFLAVNPSTADPCGSHRPFWALPTAHVNEFMRWEYNRWISAVEFVRVRGTCRDSGWEDHQRNMIMATILLRSLKASVNCHHVAKRSQLFKDKYNNREGKSLRGLDFGSSMRRTGLAWLPHDLFNWQDFHLHDELVTSTTFTFNGLQGVFANWKDVTSASREYCKARQLENRLRSSEPVDHPGALDCMRNMVYRHLALQVIRQLCIVPDPHSDPEVPDAEGRPENLGLSYDVVHTLTGEEPYLSQARKGKHGLGNTYPERVQGLFGWDDGIVRTFWDHCYYRQLARRFYSFILAHTSVAVAENWKTSLGKQALPHFWIIPHYNKHSLFTRLPKTANRPAATRTFISGLFRWKIGDHGMDLCNEERWLFGGDRYLGGPPTSLVGGGEATPDVAEVNTPTHMVDFGCSVPFTEIPRLIQEGFEATQRIFACGDQKILAHYNAAHDCLKQNLGDPLCDLLLMIVLTFAASSATPTLSTHGDEFDAGPLKDPRLFAMTLTTRMLWFLYPHRFPWEHDDGMVLRISEMIKKMEHKGVNNRTLCKLGWVFRRVGFRDNPRNSELELRPEKELLERRAKLVSLMSDPPAFIARIFRSQDEAWVERCLAIITPVD